jgi:hypothetical protein
MYVPIVTLFQANRYHLFLTAIINNHFL